MKMLLASMLLLTMCQNRNIDQTSDNTTNRASCSVSSQSEEWSRTGSIKVSVKCDTDTPIVAAMSARLQSRTSEDAFWAPFDQNGKPTRERQKRLSSKPIQLIPARLKWDSTKSSIWPSRSFSDAILPGKYDFFVQYELSDGQIVKSNQIQVVIK